MIVALPQIIPDPPHLPKMYSPGWPRTHDSPASTSLSKSISMKNHNRPLFLLLLLLRVNVQRQRYTHEYKDTLLSPFLLFVCMWLQDVYDPQKLTGKTQVRSHPLSLANDNGAEPTRSLVTLLIWGIRPLRQTCTKGTREMGAGANSLC